MKNFNYEIHPIVGRLNISEKGYGNIKVYGFMEEDNFIRLSTSEARSIFKPNGTVFASKTIQRDFYELDNSLVSLHVMPDISKKEGKNEFVWNYEYEVESIGTRIIKLKEVLGQDGGINYSILASKDLLGKEEDVFVHSDGKLYYIKADNDSQIIPYCIYDDSLPIVGGYPDDYYISNKIPDAVGYADISSDEQLVEWFLKISKANWSDIQTGSGRVALRSAREAMLLIKNLPEVITFNRIDRLQSIVGSFVVSRDSLASLAKSPWFKPTIDSAIHRYREDFLGNIKLEYQKELEELEEAHKTEIDEENSKHDNAIKTIQETAQKVEAEYQEKLKRYEDQISYAKSELQRIVEEVVQKKSELTEAQKGLDKIYERKDEIISDFSVVREVLGLSGTQSDKTSNSDTSICLKTFSYSEKRLPFYKGFENNLENCLRLSQTKVASVSEIAKLHARYSILLLPNMDVVMAIIAAAGKAWYHTAYVSVAWKSFKDIWAAGLQQIVSHCGEKPNDIHYFVLRNINLSCLSNYLQPLADMVAGYSDTFPGTEIKFPDNLRILLTVSEEELIPLSEGILQYFGCAQKTIETVKHGKINFAEATCLGYMDTSLLFGASKQIEEPANYYEDYIDEQ